MCATTQVAKDIHRLLYETGLGEPQAAMCAALALCQIMDIDHSSDHVVADFIRHHEGVQCFMKLFRFREPAAQQVK